MGKSAVRLAIKNVARNLVMPIRGVPKQPPYVRGGSTVATSPRLLAFRSCVAAGMAGASGHRVAIREKFASTAKSCAGRARA